VSYRGAIIGFGNVAVHGHLPAWLQDTRFELIAVVDPLPERLQLARTLLPDAACYGSIEACLAREQIDFVDICTPPMLHDTVLLRACEQSVHILCEKPLTLSAALMRQLQRYAVERDRAVFTVHNWQYAPLLQTLRATIAAETIGAPECLAWKVLRAHPAGASHGSGSWRTDRRIAGGGILVDHGWHLFYLAPFLLQKAPTAIAARLEPPGCGAVDIEETAAGTISCGSASVQFYLTWRADRRANEGYVRGTKGTIYFDAVSLLLERPDEPGCAQRFPESIIASSYHPEWFAPLLDDFYQALEEPSSGEANLRAAATCLALLQQGYASHRQGGVRLPL
jgi:predicted dehydrogenase